MASALPGMYNHVRPLMVTGALLASGAAASFVVAPVFAPALLTSAAVIGGRSGIPVWQFRFVKMFESRPEESPRHLKNGVAKQKNIRFEIFAVTDFLGFLRREQCVALDKLSFVAILASSRMVIDCFLSG